MLEARTCNHRQGSLTDNLDQTHVALLLDHLPDPIPALPLAPYFMYPATSPCNWLRGRSALRQPVEFDSTMSVLGH